MTVRVIVGDVRTRLAELSDESVHCCVTSPPYFGLRDYGVAGQLGLEDTPDAYVAEMVAVFREVRRVLRSDGTLWLNMGDSYASAGGHSAQGASSAGVGRSNIDEQNAVRGFAGNRAGLKPKNLIGVPWLLAFSLRADGWWLRQDIIWSKPNPMPESVTDRCTKAHEYLFMLTKSARYYFDADAIKEPAEWDTAARQDRAAEDHKSMPTGDRNGIRPRKIKMPDGWDTGAGGHGSFHREGREKGRTQPRAAGNKSHKYVDAYETSDTAEHRTKAGLMDVAEVAYEKRNKRSVWTVATAPFKEAHFATFPPALIEPCILAGAPVGGTVLDPFFGAGTTGLVADRLGRNCIGIELNPAYAAMARSRIADDAGMFADVAD